MPGARIEVIPIKRVKKDGSLDRRIVLKISEQLKNGKMVVMPVDSVFGIIGPADETTENKIHQIFGEKFDNIVRMISSFRMLEDIAVIDKNEFDFLHRVWPGEVVVKLRKKKPVNGCSIIPVRFPRNKFVQDVIAEVNQPLLFAACLHFRRKRRFKIKDLYNKYKKANMIVVIEEFLKKHPSPTVIDVTNGELIIENEGRIPAEEIKSLYFL
jgi:tRNA A37 threonylcarbamoyladenosine synthetase subunit TsaC/SUA5/YrdC